MQVIYVCVCVNLEKLLALKYRIYDEIRNEEIENA